MSEENSGAMQAQQEAPTFAGFASYKQTVIDLTGDLTRLAEYAGRMQLDKLAGNIGEVAGRLKDDTFNVAIIGEFKRGKSTLINALLGKRILPSDILPTTAAINRVTYGVSPGAMVVYKDGTTETIDIDALSDYVTKLTSESAERAANLEEAVVYYPTNYCRNGVTIIDTPGLNDGDALMEYVTLSVLPKVDVGIMVIMAGSPFSDSERRFLVERLMTSDMGRVLFVVNGIDLMEEAADKDRIVAHVRGTISSFVLDRVREQFGEDSPEYATYRDKLGAVRIFGVSARQALRAKQNGNAALMTESRFEILEGALERFLTEERGAISLIVPINRIKTASLELAKAIEMRQAALMMREEDFQQSYDKALAEIRDIREKRQQEFDNISGAMQRTYHEVVPKLNTFWVDIKRAAHRVVEDYPLQGQDINKKNINATAERMTMAVRDAVTTQAGILSEQIQEMITKSLIHEANRLTGFEEQFFTATQRIYDLFSVKEKKDSASNLVIGTLVDAFLGIGIGGAISGYKRAGWKGALLGGVTGFTGTMGGILGTSLIVGLLALPVTWPVALVTGLISGLVGNLTARWSLDRFMSGSRIEAFRADFIKAMDAEIAGMEKDENITQATSDQIRQAFEMLKIKLKDETDAVLEDTQKQLDVLKAQMAEHVVQGEQEASGLVQVVTDIDGICKRANALGAQLRTALREEEEVMA